MLAWGDNTPQAVIKVSMGRQHNIAQAVIKVSMGRQHITDCNKC